MAELKEIIRKSKRICFFGGAGVSTESGIYPAAGLINYFMGDNLVVINRSPTFADSHATLVINGSIAEALSKAVINNKPSGDECS